MENESYYSSVVEVALNNEQHAYLIICTLGLILNIISHVRLVTSTH